MFGGSGFLGLRGTGFSGFVSSTANSIESAVERGATFVSRLPNELIQAGEQLGGRLFDRSGGTQREFIDQGREFEARKTGGNAGAFLNQNFGIIAFTAAVIFLISMLSNR